jgi:ferredoxin
LKDRTIEMLPRENVLAALRRCGVSTLFNCDMGYCQECVLRSPDPLPRESQNGLSDDLKSVGCFLACRCVPTQDLRVFLPSEVPTP